MILWSLPYRPFFVFYSVNLYIFLFPSPFFPLSNTLHPFLFLSLIFIALFFPYSKKFIYKSGHKLFIYWKYKSLFFVNRRRDPSSNLSSCPDALLPQCAECQNPFVEVLDECDGCLHFQNVVEKDGMLHHISCFRDLMVVSDFLFLIITTITFKDFLKII